MKICGKWKFVISFWNLMSNTERGKEENLMVKKLFISRWKSHCSFLFLAPQKKIFWRGVSFSSSSAQVLVALFKNSYQKWSVSSPSILVLIACCVVLNRSPVLSSLLSLSRFFHTLYYAFVFTCELLKKERESGIVYRSFIRICLIWKWIVRVRYKTYRKTLDKVFQGLRRPFLAVL